MSALKSIEDAAREIPNDLATLRDDVSKLTALVADFVSKKTADATDSMMGTVEDARRKLSETTADAQDRVGGASAELEAAIRRNPLMAIALAASSGLIVGMWSRERK
jgi:ElaB/YqjD/DUF883 family membrane-anchored ribosome-binding protein